MRKGGTHTWDIIIDYHECPKCGYIFESRKAYTYRLGVYEKSEECPRCHETFTLSKKITPLFGPLLGNGIIKPTVEWE